MNYKDKEKVLRKYRSCKLWAKKLCINEDFSGETTESMKELFKQANELRKNEKFATLIRNRLISFDARQNSSEFHAGNEEWKTS